MSPQHFYSFLLSDNPDHVTFNAHDVRAAIVGFLVKVEDSSPKKNNTFSVGDNYCSFCGCLGFGNKTNVQRRIYLLCLEIL